MEHTNIRRGLSATLVVAAALSMAACGSSKPAAKPTPPPVTKSAAAPASGPADAATTAAVAKAYATFFDHSAPAAAVAASLQNADKLTATMAAAGKSPTAANISAKVTKVVLVNPHVADVTFNLLSKGMPLLSNTAGKAVLVDGTWKVAATTFCGLQSMNAGGTIPAECTPAVVALPAN